MLKSFAAEFGSMLAGNYYRLFSRRQSIDWYHTHMGNIDKRARYPSYHLNNRKVFTI
ncbi:hypothetical protein ACPOM7_01020 [Peribacillus castrilensis]|uniref:hypothetical protein n=1 Tax=Bacillaceae TaxID=186817 RepID=UPI00137AF3CB|nr:MULTISPECIES: hypothetical protein [Bacillaceae]MBD8587961.1 hypothetical protein [Peribacillus simplex]MCF7623230.1 hypothetical protein [Peribacillus frigoritolerans]MCP1153782.1 hypothetical protein [Peribacillus frigoritolerans]MCT1387022.1 hypothetical protein [Peribacillus frigoritolerans]MEA3573183.1 hypothetical protein [Peribacillus frigoritolerans]